MAKPRSRAQRKANTLAMLCASKLDAWVATSSPEAVAHVVPLSLGWDGEYLMLATEASALTTTNIQSSGRARIALGGTRDVVIIDAILATIVPADDVPKASIDLYVAQSGWDPRATNSPFVVTRMRPQRIQAWREAHEIEGRTVMRNGKWLVD